MNLTCIRCKQEKPLEDYSTSVRNWLDSPRFHECKACMRTRIQVRKHGITAAQKAEIADHHGGCRICGHSDPGGKGWVVDHDRIGCCDSDKSCPNCRRGVLCTYCNSMLGYAFDRVDTLEAAIAYLKATRSCDWHMPLACAPGICGKGESA